MVQANLAPILIAKRISEQLDSLHESAFVLWFLELRNYKFIKDKKLTPRN
jgi:hypothetical protein